MTRHEFLLPDLGEGIAEAEVISWFAEEGDEVKEHQPLLEVQTDKALVELPAPPLEPPGLTTLPTSARRCPARPSIGERI